ncbi:T-cell surface protein tactile [Periophthalmus magnuspinnatus]|uniref:T-cell surface protein tactile n=1 Tax=Periophthalmus magnuspinnatus TaxID=409849 RepID=UPI00145B4400|nr:T-cell surface protein tactile [Periophthalmus magnuspinnatus]
MTQRSTLKTASFLLLLASITQGDVPVFHYKTKEALVGQNVSLPCFLENISGITIVSAEWKNSFSKLALYVSNYGHKMFSPNVTLKTIYKDNNTLLGTRLELQNISKKDAGTYTCDISAFPTGSHQGQTKLSIKDKIECNRNSSIEVHFGKNVTIHCQEFSNVTYTWTKDEVVVSDSSSLHLQSVSVASAGLYTLTVHTGNSLLQKAFNISVSTQTTSYWADASTLSPHNSSSSNENGTTRYSSVITFATENTQNTTGSTMYNTSLSYTQSEPHNTTLSYNGSESFATVSTVSQHFNQSEASTGLSQSETYNTTLRYNHSESFDTVSTVSQHFNHSEIFNRNMSYNHTVKIHTTQPYVNNTSNVSIVYDSAPNEAEHPSKASKSTTPAPTTFLGTAGATLPSRPGHTTYTSDVTGQQDPADSEGRSHLVLALIIIGSVLLIIVALIMYRRRVLKKRDDLPPPFKPPPPPVKYTAVRNPPQFFPTDRCNSVTMISMEKRHSFV